MFLIAGSEPYGRSRSSGGPQGCSCKCNAPGCAQINAGQTLQALHTGKQGCLDKLVSPPDKPCSPRCYRKEPVAGFGLKHVFESHPDLLLQSIAEGKHMSVEFLH